MLIVWDLYPKLTTDQTPSSSRPQTHHSHTSPSHRIGSINLSHPTGTMNLNQSSNNINIAAAEKQAHAINDKTNLMKPLPIKTMFDLHGGKGVVGACFSGCGRYLVTLGADLPQSLCVWNWSCVEGEDLVASCEVKGVYQDMVTVNEDDCFDVMTTGKTEVYFFRWGVDGKCDQFVPILNSKDFKSTEITFTCSSFVSGSSEAVTGTTDGDVVVWSDRTLSNFSDHMEPGKRASIKFLKLHNSAITFIGNVSKKYIVTGGEDGFVKFYDKHLKILLWFERLKAGSISSISFSANPDSSKVDNVFEDLDIPEFTISTKSGKVLLLHRKQATGSAAAAVSIVNASMTQKAISQNSNLKKIVKSTGSSKVKEEYVWTNGTSSLTGTVHDSTISTTKTTTTDSSTTKNSDYLDSNAPCVKILLETQYDTITSIASHPSNTIFAVGSHTGLIQIFNYHTKQLLASRKFDTLEQPTKSTPALKISALSYCKTGEILCAGFTNGYIKLLNGTSLTDHTESLSTTNEPPEPPFPYQSQYTQQSRKKGGSAALLSKDKQGAGVVESGMIKVSEHVITVIRFNEDMDWLACADDGYGVSVIHREPIAGGVGVAKKVVAAARKSTEIHSRRGSIIGGIKKPAVVVKEMEMPMQWVFYGRNQAHFERIVSLMFVELRSEDVVEEVKLISVSYDRNIAEYDYLTSSISGGLQIKSLKKIEQSAHPLSAILHPNFSAKSTDSFLLTTNTEFKFKVYNSRTLFCRKTVLGPTLCGNINNIQVIPSKSNERYVAYSTEQKVVGVIKLPLDGNPHRVMSVIAHPEEISNLSCTNDGEFLLTAGGKDGTVNLWNINPHSVDAQLSLGGLETLEPFLNLADEETGKYGKDGEFYREMEDYFYYAQLRSQGESASVARKITEKVKIDQVPSIMQAMGFFPSEYEIENMINEVKYSKVDLNMGLIDSINFPDLIKLFVNHKPAINITEEDLFDALKSATEPGKENSNEYNETGVITKDGLSALIQLYGESFSDNDLTSLFQDLLKGNKKYKGALPNTFSNKEFVQDILGLEVQIISKEVEFEKPQ